MQIVLINLEWVPSENGEAQYKKVKDQDILFVEVLVKSYFYYVIIMLEYKHNMKVHM